MAVFTKFDAQVILEYAKLKGIQDGNNKWVKARENAENILQDVYLPLLWNTKYPPKAFVQLEGKDSEICLVQAENTLLTDMHKPEMDCPQLTEKTADAIDIASLHQLFSLAQKNNLNLNIKSALQ